MHKNISPQSHNEEEQIEKVLRGLSESPNATEVERSFRATMDAVTKLPEHRIPEQTQTESNFIHSPLMLHMRKIMGATVATLALVLVVGYVTFNGERTGQYDDIYAAALGEEGSYEIPFDNVDDDFSDIFEETASLDVDESVKTKNELPTSDASNQNEAPAVTNSFNDEVEKTLLALDSLFAEDDIDDSELEEWFADTSAGNVLTQSYGI